MTHTPQRISWGVDVVDPRPEDVVLEIGCGSGVAASLVCERLDGGRLIAVDRSATAVRRASVRNARWLDDRVLEVRQLSLNELSLPTSSVDKAFSINVNLFWVRDPASELALLRRALRPGGLLALLFDGGPQGVDRVTAPIRAALDGHGFSDIRTVKGPAGIGVLGRKPGD